MIQFSFGLTEPEALPQINPLWSSEYIIQPYMICRVSFMHWTPWALSLARPSAGNSMAARIAMIAITTSSSIRVNPRRQMRSGDRANAAGGLTFFITDLGRVFHFWDLTGE